MTVSAFFGIVLKMILYPLAFYWIIKLYFFNEENLEFAELWNNNVLFLCSFIVSIIFGIITIVCFIAYSIYNRNKALTIVFSPKYLYERYWKDVSKAFEG